MKVSYTTAYSDVFHNEESLWQRPSMSHQHTGAKMSVKIREEEITNARSVHSRLSNSSYFTWDVSDLTMFVQALANVMYLGLNCRVLMGPGCFPSSTATFIPLSVLQTWILPSSEPAQQDTSHHRSSGRDQHINLRCLGSPIMTNCESGVKQASREMPLLLL